MSESSSEVAGRASALAAMVAAIRADERLGDTPDEREALVFGWLGYRELVREGVEFVSDVLSGPEQEADQWAAAYVREYTDSVADDVIITIALGWLEVGEIHDPNYEKPLSQRQGEFDESSGK